MDGTAFAYSTINIATEASKVALQVLQYLMERSRYEMHMRLYENAYGKDFADIMRNPDKYATFKLSGEIDANELKDRLIKCGMNEWDITTFDGSDDLLCVDASNREKFNDIIELLEAYGDDAFIKKDEPVSETLPAPTTAKRYRVNENGEFVEITDHFFKDVIERRDDRGEPIGSSAKGDKAKETAQFVRDHRGIYIQTPHGNMIDETKIRPDGSCDKSDVILMRDEFGNITHENGEYELGARSRDVLKNFDDIPYRTVMGGFVNTKEPRTFIPARMPGTGDYYNYITGSAVITSVGMPDRDDPSFERVYRQREEAVLKHAESLRDSNQEFILDLDGNFIGKSDSLVVDIADENGICRKDGKVVSKDEKEQDGLERTDDSEDKEDEEKTEKKPEEEKEEEQEEKAEENAQDAGEEKEEKSKEKKKKKKQESHEQERGYTESSESSSQEYVEQTPAPEPAAETTYAESYTEPEYHEQEPAPSYSEGQAESYSSQEYTEQPSYPETSYTESQSSGPEPERYEQPQSSSCQETPAYSEGQSETYSPSEQPSSYEASSSHEEYSHQDTAQSYQSAAQSYSDQTAEQSRARENEATAERARAAEESARAEKIFGSGETRQESGYKESSASQANTYEQNSSSATHDSYKVPEQYGAGSGSSYSNQYSESSYHESRPAQEASHSGKAGFSGSNAFDSFSRGSGSSYSGGSVKADYAEAIKAASAPAYQSAPESSSQSHAAGSGAGAASEHHTSQEYGFKYGKQESGSSETSNGIVRTTASKNLAAIHEAAEFNQMHSVNRASSGAGSFSHTGNAAGAQSSTPGGFAPRPAAEAQKSSDRYAPKNYGFTYGQQIGESGASNAVVHTTASKNLTAMRDAASSNQMAAATQRPAVGRDTSIQTNFLNQRKIFGAQEIRVAGASQKQGIRSAVNLTSVKTANANLIKGLAMSSAREDPRTNETMQAMHGVGMAHQFMQLRNGAYANTLRKMNEQAMLAGYRNGQLDNINNFLKRNGKAGFNDKIFTGNMKEIGKKNISKMFDKSSNDFMNALAAGRYIKPGYGGFAFVSDNSLNSAVHAIFGPGQTPAEFAANKKYLKGFVEGENAKKQALGSIRKSKRALMQHVIGMVENSDPSTKSLHQGYHMLDTARQTREMLRQAVSTDFKWTYSKVGIRGRYDRHKAAYKKLQAKAMGRGGPGVSVETFDKQVALFKEKSKAELKNLNKRQMQEYKRLRKAKQQQDWINAHRGRLHAREQAQTRLKETIGNVRDFPKNAIKKQGRKVTNWAGNTKPGKAVNGLRNAASQKMTSLATKFGNTKVGKAFNKVKKLFGKANEFAAKLRRLFQKILNQIIRHILTFLLAYVGTIFFIGLFMVLVVMPLSTNFSMFVDNWKTMVDEASSVESISGTVYSELRYMEIEWASDIRAYGTSANPIMINNDKINYTDQNLTAEEYLNSEAGTNDLLGAYAEDTDAGFLASEQEKYGVQGPTPFEGAKLDDYKVIKQVDGGNVLEILGKPQEGWTSNSKEVISMATVFYAQCVDEVATETNTSVSSWNDFWNSAKEVYHRVGQWFEAVDFPILGWIAGGTDWSFTGLYRNYAYPLALNSHLENFYLSTYIYPTKWTAPELADGADDETSDDDDAGNNTSAATHEKSEGHEDSRYDTDQENKIANDGDATLNKQWGASRHVQSKHGTLGIGKNGGSGKVDSKNQVSKSLWGSLGDDSYQGFETCGDTTPAEANNSKGYGNYNGYGCLLRYRFSYKWSQAFGTDADGNILDEAAVESSGFNKLHYGEADSWNEPNEGDGEGEDENNNNVEYQKTGQDVSADVSPYYQDADAERGYQIDNCLVYPLKLSATGWSCWEETGQTDISMDNGGGYYPEWVLWNKKSDFNHYHFVHGYENSWVDGKGEWAIDKIVTTGEGFDLYAFRIPFDSETGEILYDHATDATVYHFKHNCTGKHQGIYCGGHAQLRTRGIVYGLSKEQLTDQVLDDDEKSLYDPKYIDPDSEEKETTLYGDALTVRNEQITTFNVDEVTDVVTSQITEEDAQYVKDARDLYDIDILISKPKDMYPQYDGVSKKTVIKQLSSVYLSVLFPGAALAAVTWNALSGAPTVQVDSESSTNTEPWKSWTLTNMSQVASMISENWHDAYQVVDTQTIVGGQDGINSLDDDMANNVLDQLGWNDIENGIDIGSQGAIENLKKIRKEKGAAVVNGKELSISEEMELVNQLRHLKYAMSLVGKVSYSQDQHPYLWGNLSGHQTDCSGFVSNVWRDVLKLTSSKGAMTTVGLKAYAGSALKPYTGADTDGIEPGDIILKNPDDMGGSAHALIYVGVLDPVKLYLDRTATEGSEGSEEYKFYNDDGSLKYGGEGSPQVYAIDCSSMTITTVAYEDNAPNTLKEFFSSATLTDGFKKLLGTNYEPNGGVKKVRSGNVRFSAKSYLNDNSAGCDLYYIDMDQLAKDKGIYSFNSDGTITSIYGTFFDDYSNFQSKSKEASHASSSEAVTDSSGNVISNATMYNKFAESSYDFWEINTELGTELDRRQTVHISSDEGEKEKEAEELEVTDPPIQKDVDFTDSSDYDDFDWQNYADQLPEGEFKEQLKELIDYYGESQWAKYYASGLIQIKQTSDGRLVFYEEQASKWNGQTVAYGSAVAGSDGTNTVARRGCFLYALAAAVSAKTGKIYTLQEVIKESGGTLKWNSNGTLTMSGLGTVGGDGTKLNNVLSDAGLSGSYHGKTKVSLSAIDKGLQEGKVYCVWSTSASDPNAVLHSASGAGMHWTTIIGRTSSGNYIVACNGGRGMEISPSQMPKYFESYAEIG